jgi:uncharacterized protein (TIGR02996 family)
MTTTLKTWTPVDGFLQEIRQDFNDDGLRLIFADYLDEKVGPTPVTLGKIPNWLRLRFHRERPVYFIDTWATLHSSAWAVRDAIKEFLQRTGPAQLGSLLDHDGTTTVGEHLCFVSECYATDKEAVRYFRYLAQGLGCVDAFARDSWHTREHPSASGCSRILLFPPAAGLPPDEAKAAKRRKRWGRSYTCWGYVNGTWEPLSKGQRHRRTCVELLYRGIAQRDLPEWACAITTTGKPPSYVPHAPNGQE